MIEMNHNGDLMIFDKLAQKDIVKLHEANQAGLFPFLKRTLTWNNTTYPQAPELRVSSSISQRGSPLTVVIVLYAINTIKL